MSDGLKDAFDEMLAGLERARQELGSPHAPPSQSARDRAEGYRYLMGFTYAAIERARNPAGLLDPVAPAKAPGEAIASLTV